MQFNGDSDNQDICSLADDMANSNDVSFPLWKKAMYANWACREIFSWIMNAYGGWILDDSKNSGNPEYTQTLTSGTSVYALATALDLFALEYKDSAGNWAQIKPITLEKINDMGYSESEFMTTSGYPLYYRPVQGGVKLYPAPNITVANGLRAQITRDIVKFLSTSTSEVPGFDSNLHEGVPLFMALQHCKAKSKPIASQYQIDWDGNEAVTFSEGGFKKRVKKHYAAKFRQNFPGGVKHSNRMVDQYVS